MIRIFIIIVLLIVLTEKINEIEVLKKEIKIIETKNFELQLDINDILKVDVDTLPGVGIKVFKHKTAMKYRSLND